MDKQEIIEEGKSIKLQKRVKITYSQMAAIAEAANILSAMVGGGEDDTQFRNTYKAIDRFLKSNGLKRKYK